MRSYSKCFLCKGILFNFGYIKIFLWQRPLRIQKTSQLWERNAVFTNSETWTVFSMFQRQTNVKRFLDQTGCQQKMLILQYLLFFPLLHYEKPASYYFLSARTAVLFPWIKHILENNSKRYLIKYLIIFLIVFISRK